MAECLYCAVHNHPLCSRIAFNGRGMNAVQVRCACARRSHRPKQVRLTVRDAVVTKPVRKRN